MRRLEGKSVLIPGAGSGIGRAASLLFTKEGAKLIAVDRSEAVKENVEQERKAGGTGEAVTADAGSEKEVIAFIAKAVSAYGRTEAIWANAGVSAGLVPPPVQTRQDFTKHLSTTLQTGADQLVLADPNEEGANMLALQTRQQLSTTALSLSAQADQAVLRLFG